MGDERKTKMDELAQRAQAGDREALGEMIALMGELIRDASSSLVGEVNGPRAWSEFRAQLAERLRTMKKEFAEKGGFIPAGNLREMGVDVPDYVPDQAPYRYAGADVVEEDGADSKVTFNMRFEPY